MLIPASAAGQTPEEMAVKVAVDHAGITVDKLMVIPVEGIVIVRGRVASPEVHKRLAQVLSGLDLRIANLVKILPIPDDVRIQLAAERALHTTRTLDGSNLRVSSNDGIVTLQGSVRHELQRDAAISILRGVEGVLEVHTRVDKM